MTLTMYIRRVAVALAVILAVLVFLVGNDVWTVRAQTVDPAAPMDVTSAATATPPTDLAPVLPRIEDKLYVQGAKVAITLPAATGGDSHPNYTYTLTPDPSGIGLSFDPDTRKLTGTLTNRGIFTYRATELAPDAVGDPESATKPFTIGVRPSKPANFNATGGNAQATLRWSKWKAIPGPACWYSQPDGGGWTAIPGGAATVRYTETGLTNGTEYVFKVRVYVGVGDARVNGVGSDAQSAPPAPPEPDLDGAPVLPRMWGKHLLQGDRVDTTLPAATGGDSHPNYTYALTPDVSGIGLAFDPATRRLTGIPTNMGVFTYRATELGPDAVGGPESVTRTFTISIQPSKPTGFTATATAGAGQVTLRWTANGGFADKDYPHGGGLGWEYQQGGGGAWTAIPGSGAATVRYTVTGLTAGTEYLFKVRAFVGVVDTRVNGVESDSKSATPN